MQTPLEMPVGIDLNTPCSQFSPPAEPTPCVEFAVEDFLARIAKLTRLQKAQTKASEWLPKAKASTPRTGRPTLFNLDDAQRDPASVVCMTSSSCGLGLQRVYLVDNSCKRTVVLEYEQALNIPEMEAAMEEEIESHRK